MVVCVRACIGCIRLEDEDGGQTEACECAGRAVLARKRAGDKVAIRELRGMLEVERVERGLNCLARRG